VENVTVTINNDTGEVIFWDYSGRYTNIFDVENKLFSITTIEPKEDEKAEYKIEIFSETIEQKEIEELLRFF
jgi:hypothetical protein